MLQIALREPVLGKTHKSIFQSITSNGRYGGGGFRSGRYKFKTRFFLVVIIKAPISIKNSTNIFLLTRDFETPTISHNFCSNGSQPMLSMFSRVTGDAQSLVCAISFSVV